MKTIGIVGSRSRRGPNDFKALEKAFDEIFEPGDRVVSGGCTSGADAFAESISRNRGLTIIIHHADWKTGQTAGFVRNTRIAEDADVLIAVVARDRMGGTEDTIKKAQGLGKRVVLV